MVLLIITYLVSTTPMYIISANTTGDKKIPCVINGSTLQRLKTSTVWNIQGYLHSVKYTIILWVPPRVSLEKKKRNEIINTIYSFIFEILSYSITFQTFWHAPQSLNQDINIYLLKIDKSMPSFTINGDMGDVAKLIELKI